MVQRRKYRILTLDGGGIRSAYTATILIRLAAKFPTLLKSVDLIAGTSAGAALGLGLASGKTPQESLQFLIQNAGFVFSNPRPPLNQPEYSNRNLIIAMTQFLTGTLRLNQLKKQVVVPAFQVRTPSGPWRPAVFNNFPGSPNASVRVVDAAVASQSLPIAFPSYMNFVDGGVFANNPSMLGISYGVDRRFGRQRLEDIVLLSIGTGFNPYRLNGTENWGAIQWSLNPNRNEKFQPTFPLNTVNSDGVNEIDTQYSQSLLNDRFNRINVNLGAEAVAADDVSAIPRMIALGKQSNLTRAESFIRTRWF
ncbi:patatin-like phospholipase family protein [Hazenella sp. IB182357]|uniref:Patatin-like phospholipase family protein n=1 Tax=Polycladospora coralii TaxID=2771432 RepID=A0A926NC32_9BACL|nr:patatin-like phospholipase family protein [Polycladospora coralii]MBD1373060.1 patatin-like phospholipase family protein [Polycladospora coralii]